MLCCTVRAINVNYDNQLIIMLVPFLDIDYNGIEVPEQTNLDGQPLRYALSLSLSLLLSLFVHVMSELHLKTLLIKIIHAIDFLAPT